MAMDEAKSRVKTDRLDLIIEHLENEKIENELFQFQRILIMTLDMVYEIYTRIFIQFIHRLVNESLQHGTHRRYSI